MNRSERPTRSVLVKYPSLGIALVMDIAGFTAFTTRHDPETVMRTLDHLLADTSEVIARNGGVVLSYLGDGFLATINASVANERPADSAFQASKDLLAAAEHHRFDVRIGIATGDLVTGIVGSDSRQAFTVYGDTVHLASRQQRLRVTTPQDTRHLVKITIREIAEQIDVFALRAIDSISK